jgi:hypothetical protein
MAPQHPTQDPEKPNLMAQILQEMKGVKLKKACIEKPT